MIGTPVFAQRGQQQSAQITTIPAPIKGMDVRQTLSHMEPDISIFSYNFTPAPYGMELRKGFREWASKIYTNKVDTTGVRSILTFTGGAAGTGDDKLFAVTNQGIYDITDYNAPPVEKILFPVPTETAGYGIDLQYEDEGGHQYLFYADDRNGLYYYDPVSGDWAEYNGITGIVREEIVYITVHKQRIWVALRDSSTGYYLDPAAVSGSATPFYFGSLFSHGGHLKGLYNWSIDGGSGTDDMLVAVSSTGDVLPYKGEDPSTSDTWSLVGKYFVGAIPFGRRIMNEFGGSLYLLSSYGVIGMQDLLKGVDPKDVSASSIAYKIAPIIRSHIEKTRYQYGWEIMFAPSEGIFIVNAPIYYNEPQIQYIMDLTTEGWGMWRGVPMNCMKEWGGKVFFGQGNSVYVMDGTKDKVKKEVQEGVSNGIPIEFSLLTSFQKFGGDGLYKKIELIRPDFMSTIPPDYLMKAVYDYKFVEPTLPYSVSTHRGGFWDIGRWDNCVWQSDDAFGISGLHGASGIGRTAAVAIRGSTSAKLRLISFDIVWKAGGAI